MGAPSAQLSGLIFFVLGLSSAACRAGKETYPPVEAVDRAQVRYLIEQRNGKVILLNVWATWCAPCREEMPILLNLRTALREKGFELLLLSADDFDLMDTKVRPMLKEFGVDFLTFIKNDDDDEAFINGLDPDWEGALPTSFLYDAKGTLVETMVGAKTSAQFEEAIMRLLRKGSS